MGKQVMRNVFQWIDKIAYFLLAVILFDCMACGGGSYLKVRGIDIRMVWYGLFFLLSLPSVFRSLKKLLTNSYVVILILWLAWLIFCTVKGFRLGNDTNNIIAGLIGFASFGILPGALAVLTSKKRILGLMKLSVIATVFLAFQTIALAWMHNLDGEFLIRINPRFLEIELGALSIVDQDLVRVFMRSHPLSILGCGSAVYLAVKAKGKLPFVLYCGAAALGLLAAVLSFTRSLYLAVFVMVAFLLLMGLCVLKKAQRKRLMAGAAATVILFAVFLVSLDAVFGTSILSYGVQRSVGYDMVTMLNTRFPNRLRVDLTPSPDEPYVLGGIPPKPIETVPGDTDPTKDTDTKPTETKPKPTKPTETKPKPTKPAETKPAETKPIETTPAPTVPPVDHNQISDDLRGATKAELMEKINQNLLVGNGMGVVLTVRENKDGVNEYFYLDQIMKTGLIGIGLYMLPMALMLVNLLFRKKKMEPDDVFLCSVWLAALLGVAVFSHFNPYLNGSNGIVLYCSTIAVLSELNGKQQLFQK